MSDLALNLRIRVNDDGSVQVLNRTSSGIDRIASSANQASGSISNLSSGIGKFATAIGGAFVVEKIADDLLHVNREFQSLRASLATTVGGIENSKLAFSFIQDFAAKTPYDVAQVTESFILLGNMGLKPTEEALRSYGNTAAAQAKPIKQMIEAVADAATGEFERLKEFGIKAAADGDKVAFTFQGVTTTVGNSAAEIEQYLINLGNNKFGDAMAGQAAIINGSISNLGDTWDSFMDHLLDDNKENLIAKWVKTAGDAIHWLDIGINGAITNADKLGVIDQRIAGNRASLAAHQSNGLVGGLIDDLSGYDANLKKNQIDADIKAREALTKTIAAQQTAQDNLVNSMGKSNAASAGAAAANKGAEEATKKAASEAKKAATEAQNKADAIVKAIADEIRAQDEQLKKLTMTERAYKDYELGALHMTDAVKAAELAKWDLIKAAEAEKKGIEAGKSAMDTEIDRYNQLTLSAHNYFIEKLKAQGVAPDKIPAISALHDKSDGIEKQQKATDAARQALESYNTTLDSTKDKLADLGSVSSSVFDGALGGISAMAGAFSNMVSSIDANMTALDKLGQQQAAVDRFQPSLDKDQYLKDLTLKQQLTEKNAKEEAQLTEENTKLSLASVRQMAGATASMFAENSKGRRIMHGLEMSLGVIEMAMQLKGLAVKAASAILNQGEGDPYTAFARIAAMAAVVGGIVAAAGGAFSGGGSSAPPVMSSDTGTVLGDSTAKSESIDKTYELLKSIHADEYVELRGINKGISDLRNGITDTVTRLFQAGGVKDFATLAPATNALTGNGSMGSPIHQAVVSFLFGGKQTQTVTQQGISTQMTAIADIMAGADLMARQFAVIETKTKGGLFTKTKTSYSTQYAELDADTQKAMTTIFKSVGETMLGVADSLGEGLSDRVKNYIIPALTIDLKGLSGEDATKKLTGVISTALDTMSSAVFGDIVGRYQQLGEGMLETAIRIVSEVAVVKDALSKSGLSIATNAIAISDALVQAAGGLEEFQKQFGTYFDKFYTDAEKQADLQSRLLTVLDGSLATSREGYRQQYEALDLTNEKDLERASLLIKMAGAADQYYSALEAAAAATDALLKTLSDDVTTARNNLAEAYKNESAALTATIDKFEAFSKSLKNFRAGLLVGDLSTGTPEDKYLAAKYQFNSTLNKVKAGAGSTDASKAVYELALSDIQNKASAFLSSSRDFNASGEDYKTDFNSVLSAINKGIIGADAAKTDAQNQLTVLNKSVEGLITINKSVLSVKDAITALGKTIGLEQATKNQIAAKALMDSTALTAAGSKQKLDAGIARAGSDQAALSTATNSLSYYQGLSTKPSAGNPLWDTIMVSFKADHDAIYGANTWSQDVINRATPGLQAKYAAQRAQGIADAKQSIDQLTPLATASAAAVTALTATWKADKTAADNALAAYSTATALVNAAKTVADSTKTVVSGSHRTGLSRVPYDGYIAELHKDERVLTAEESANYNPAQQRVEIAIARPAWLDNLTIKPGAAATQTDTRMVDALQKTIDELKEQNKHLRASVNVLQSGFTKLIQQNDEQAEHLEGIGKSTKRALS